MLHEMIIFRSHCRLFRGVADGVRHSSTTTTRKRSIQRKVEPISNPMQEAELFIKALTSLRQTADGMDVQSTSSVDVLQRLFGPANSEEAGAQSSVQSQTLKNAPAAAIAWSVAKLQLLRFFKHIRAAAIEKLDDYSDEELNHLIFTLGATRIKDDELFQALSDQVVGRLQAGSRDGDDALPPVALSLSTVAMTFVMNQVPNRQVLDAVALYACKLYERGLRNPSIDLVSDSELLSLSWSFIAAGIFDKSLFSTHVKTFLELAPPDASSKLGPPSKGLFEINPPEQLHEACLAWRMVVSPVLPSLLQSLVTPEWFRLFKDRCEDFVTQPVKMRLFGSRHQPLSEIVEYLRKRDVASLKQNYISRRGLFADLYVGGRTIVLFHTTKDDLLSDQKTTTGLRRLRARLLTMEGYRVIELSQAEWSKLSAIERAKVLDQVIATAVGDAPR